MIRAGIIAVVVFVQAGYVAAQRVEVPVTAFKFSGQGRYVWKRDRRDLFQIIHPWTTSKAGDFGQMEAEVAVPAEAKPPLTLVFYVMDNDYTGPVNTGADWINRDVRVGHRFRQALVNGQVVWQQDTCLDDVSQHYLVDISDRAQPGKTIKVAFRLWEAVDSGVTLPGDVYITEHYATKVATAVKQVVKDRYETKSYWGDVAIYTGVRPKPEEIPWGGQIVLKPPALPPDETAAADKVSLGLEKGELLSGLWPWPVIQGIPFRTGAVKAPGQLGLAGPDGNPLAADLTTLNTWPDGSVQWALAAFTLRPRAAGPFELHRDRKADGPSAAPAAPANPVASQDDLSMKNGLVGISWLGTGQGSPLAILAGDGCRVSAGPAAYLRTAGKQFQGKWSGGRWLVRSAQTAELEANGDLIAADGDRYGVCRLRAAMFAGCPYVRLLYTVMNQRSEKTTAIEAYGLKLPTEEGRPAATGPGWVSLRTKGGSLTAVVRWFARLWPNGLEPSAAALDFQFFKPGDPRLPAYNTHPGEAKTQEIWLAVTPETPSVDDCRKLAALVETPPRLDVSALIRGSRVWGELPRIAADEHPEVYTKVEQSLAAYFENCKQNVRLFGEYPNWDNFYWNTLHTMYTLYALTGQRKWFDWAERSVRHHFDVDICHWQPEKNAVGVVGAMHGYWGDHSDTPCYSLIQNCDGAFDHWNLTGDPDGYRYGVGIAEYVRGSPHIGRGGSTREQGWPLICMLAAWRQTGEKKYGEHARLLAEAAQGFLEQRRGTYIEVHGSVSYLGPTPFMYGILCTALRQYHLRTGDQRAALLIARLANAVYEESHDPFHSKTLPNVDYYYSPNPYLRGGDGFTPITTLNLNIAAAQAYGAYVTQDAGLAEIARRSWQAGLEGGTVYPEMAYDLPGVVWWLDKK
jgi:hypothetical protein